MSNIDKFLESCTVIDTETTNLNPEQAEIVEIASAIWTGKSFWHVNGRLLNARNGIPPEASAKNNIGPRLIKDQPYFDQVTKDIKDLLRWDQPGYFVAHNCSYDQAVLESAWKRVESASDARLARDQSRWICTWRLSRHVLGHQFGDIEYGLNYLRFLLDLDVPDDHGVHRAADDTLTCAMLLHALADFAIENGQITDEPDIAEQVHGLCWSPITITKWPFGKHKGDALDDISNDYYAWALKTLPQLRDGDTSFDSDLSESVRLVLERRLSDL